MVGKADRSEHEAEIARLELAAKRAESSVNKDRRDLIEQNAMSQAQQAEKTKRKDGKGDWHMKKCGTIVCVVVLLLILFL